MICRHWRGWTTRENAEVYQTLLTGTIMPQVFARNIEGMVNYQAMHRDMIGDDGNPETEHATLIWFTSVDAIKQFVGDDHEAANMPDAAQAVLKRWDTRVLHYEVFDQRSAENANGTPNKTPDEAAT